jgi:LemA protein
MEQLIPLLILFLFLLIPILYPIVQYNQLVSLRNYIQNAWSNVDTELKRRYDLIPNLVASVKGYTTHEREILETVTQLRNRCAANNGSPSTQATDENQLVSALQRLLVVVENYPQLKADEHFLDLQRELSNTEDRIQAARRFYNGNVRDYLDKCQSFPSNLIANLFHFQPHDFFEVSSAVRDTPQVGFSSQDVPRNSIL